MGGGSPEVVRNYEKLPLLTSEDFDKWDKEEVDSSAICSDVLPARMVKQRQRCLRPWQLCLLSILALSIALLCSLTRPASGKLPPMPRPPHMSPETFTFYMYRAQGDLNYPLENSNAVNLAGLLWYLHNHVVVSTPRQHGITRIVRFRVTVKNTQKLLKERGTQFGPFVAFNSGLCLRWNCSSIFKQFGFVVGCRSLSSELRSSMRSSYTELPSTNCTGRRDRTTPRCIDRFPTSCGEHGAPVFYSLPGACPTQNFAGKRGRCTEEEPGGSCEIVTGTANCTYHADAAGVLRLDDVVGISDYSRFLGDGGVEYDVDSDRGRGVSFWDGRFDALRCRQRMERIAKLFREHWPDPLDLEQDLCCSSQ